ncbi:MAG: hypothetical protein ABIT83_04975 [Massilia sp.]
MKKMPSLAKWILGLNAFLIATVMAICTREFEKLEWALIVVVAPIACFFLAWLRVRFAPRAAPANMPNVLAIVIISVVAAVLVVPQGLAGANSVTKIVPLLILFYSFSADIFFENC